VRCTIPNSCGQPAPLWAEGQMEKQATGTDKEGGRGGGEEREKGEVWVVKERR